MPEPQKIVTCEKCGNRLAIPPEYVNTPGKCPKCGGIVNQPKPAAPAGGTPGLPPLEGAAPSAGIPSPQPAAPLGSSNALGSLLDSDVGDLKPTLLDSDGAGTGLPGVGVLDSDGAGTGLPGMGALDSDRTGAGLAGMGALDSDGVGTGLPGLGALDSDGLGVGVTAVDPLGTAGVAPPPAKDEPKPEPDKTSVGKIVTSVAVWSAGAGIVFAAAMAGIAFASMTFLEGGRSSGGQIASTLYNGAGIGLVFGLLVGSIWGLVRVTSLSLLAATPLGAVIGLVLSVSYHFAQEFLTGMTSDMSPIIMAAIGAGAGAACGVTTLRFKEYLEERD